MNASIDRTGAEASPIGGGDDIRRAIADGALAKQYGLEVGDLRVGLTVAGNLLRRGQADEALRLYVALVLCAPRELDFQLGLANCALLAGQNYLAIQAAAVLIAGRPDDPQGYFISGRACLATGNEEEAREDFGEAIRCARKTGDLTILREAELLLSRASVSRPNEQSSVSA